MKPRHLDIGRLYARHQDELMLFLARRTADPEIALDLWSETFAQAVLSRGRYRGSSDEEAGAWLFGIARHQLAKYYRRGQAERRAMTKLGLERPPLEADAAAELMRRADLGTLRRELATAVAVLSDDVRHAITLRVIDELPYPEVASRLDISEPAARARVSRGLRTLADALDPRDIDEALQA